MPFSDQYGPYDLWELRNRNPKFGRHNRPNLYYPIYVDPDSENEDGLYSIVLRNQNHFQLKYFQRIVLVKIVVGDGGRKKFKKKELMPIPKFCMEKQSEMAAGIFMKNPEKAQLKQNQFGLTQK